MSLARLYSMMRRIAPRLIRLVVLVAVCCAQFPIPVGTTAVKDRSEPFPCQDRPCGCRTAANCWRRCCCFTNAQKVVWAELHHIRLPSFVSEAAEIEQLCEDSGSKNCCQKKSDGTGCSLVREARIKQCDDNAPGGETGLRPPASNDRALHSDYVIGVLRQDCQGGASAWLGLPWSVVPELEQHGFQQDGIPEVIMTYSESLRTRDLAPPVPPPRIAA